MSHGINEPITPDVLDPEPLSVKTGDPNDDDAQAIDDTLLPNPGLPVDYSGLVPQTDHLEKATRILSRRITVGSPDAGATQYDPVQLFPVDPNRKNVTITLDVTGTVGQVQIASEKSDVYNGPIYNGSYGPIQLIEHTGAVWIYSAQNQLVTVNAWCVTV